MTEISNMVSYYNHPLMYGRQQQNLSPGSPVSQQMSTPHHQAASSQETSQQQCTNWYYQHHHHHQQQQQQYLVEAAAAAESSMPLWPAHAHPAYLQYHQHHAAQQAYQQQQMQVVAAASNAQTQQSLDWSSEEANNNGSANANGNASSNPSNPAAANGNANGNAANNGNAVGASEPSPAITVSGSEISSPGTPASPTGNNNNLNVPNNNSAAQMRPSTNRSPFEWMKKNSYQPNPGKTRTKEKYRVVYTEHQRLELEKEFYSSKYITIRRKAELATSLALSERQVKIWFQNRRAKERKQTKKRSELEQRDIKPILDAHGVAHAPPTTQPPPVSGMANLSLNNMSMSSLMSNLMPPAPSPTALMAHHHHHHHHHPLLGAAVAAAAHHPQHSVIGM